MAAAAEVWQHAWDLHKSSTKNIQILVCDLPNEENEPSSVRIRISNGILAGV